MTTPGVKIKHLFSAPVFQFILKGHEQLNQSLKSVILSKREELPAEKMSNAGGWQSPKNLQDWESPCVRQLIDGIDIGVFLLMTVCLDEEAVQSMRRWHVAAWANVNERGDYNMIHNYSGGVWSGVYYVSAGTPDPDHPFSGVLTFRSPTMAALALDNLDVPEQLRRVFPSEYSVAPQDGLVVLFPSWLDHLVHPYFGSAPRISVSWDVIF
jgi:uncharacterized protein (TIGR02466 family)